MLNYVYRGCICLQVHTETRGVRSPGAGVTGDCEPPEMGTWNMLLTAELFLQSQTLFTFLLFMLSDLFETSSVVIGV